MDGIEDSQLGTGEGSSVISFAVENQSKSRGLREDVVEYLSALQ